MIRDEVLKNLEMLARAFDCLAALVHIWHLHGDWNLTYYLALLQVPLPGVQVLIQCCHQFAA